MFVKMDTLSFYCEPNVHTCTNEVTRTCVKAVYETPLSTQIQISLRISEMCLCKNTLEATPKQVRKHTGILVSVRGLCFSYFHVFTESAA